MNVSSADRSGEDNVSKLLLGSEVAEERFVKILHHYLVNEL